MVVQFDSSECYFDSSQCYRAGDNTLTWIREISGKVVTPAHVVRRLAVNFNPELGIEVADHLNAAEALLLSLADVKSDVRYGIAENHNIARNVLNKLCDVRDITERKEAEAALNYAAATFKRLFNQAFQFMAILTPEGVLKEANQSALDFIGAKLEDVQGKLFWETPWWSHSPQAQERLQRAVEKAAAGDFVRYESLHLGSDGQPIIMDFSLKPARDDTGKVVTLIAEDRDITDLKHLMEQREDYVATLTHDLKTPILAANRAIKLLINGDFGELTKEQSRILQTIIDSNEAMFGLVRTLLDVYRYESGAKTLSLAKIDLGETAANLLEELQPIADLKQVKLGAAWPPDPVSLVCDGEEIRRVLQNLVDNALKFTPPGGSVIVRIERAKGGAIVAVSDNGKGIPEHEQSQLFQRFWQQAQSGRHYASTGLGLYLCRKIVELHGGKIWCESTAGLGTTFHFTLPVRSNADVVS